MSKLNRELRRHARLYCACFDLDTRDECLLEKGEGCTCAYFRDEGGRCAYFERAVLPINPRLNEIYRRSVIGHDDGMGNAGTCANCGAAYARRSNRQKYCESCRDGAAKDRTKLRVRDYRQRQRKTTR
ncbi:cysteine-rich VLP protein [Numidum massiliense]|uniref:cysteine-rich VLP protein n=1 Tax=Numidum massiliense TaxID=1522315 RepID=UPI0006D58697|nr:cysteine-rich VLP protein [Numidum massiliense]